MAETKRAGIIIGIIIFAIIVTGLYGIIYAAPRIEGIGIRTETIQHGQLPIADEVKAIFVRDEVLYTATYSGIPEYMVKAGTKVRAGTQVIYIEPAPEPLDVEAVVITSDTESIEAEGEGMDEYPDGGLFEAIFAETVARPATFESMLEDSAGGAAASEGGVTPRTAIVSYYGDGWEHKVTPDNIMSLPKSVFDEAPGEAVDLTREWVRAGEPVYRITNNNLWRVAFWFENADKTVLDRYSIGRRVSLDLGTTRVRANVEVAEPRGRDLFIVLKSDMYYRYLDRYRLRDISVVFSEVSGAVIEKHSVKLRSGQTGVYVKQQSGTFKWMPVKVVRETGNHYLIAEGSFEEDDGTRVATIKYYDEIMSNPAAQGF
ncbi:MAG: hypothetical protein FWH32_00385 [Clostridiales bacterium]|nr:hypothetical protein [Clostridiales bacterium]